MAPDLFGLYQALPYPFKILALNCYGSYLHWWRYGPKTEQLVEQALDREKWDRPKWEKWQSERLLYILNRAATKVPYYKKYWEDRRRRGDNSSWEDLNNWPILKRHAVREHPEDLVAEDRNISFMFRDRTSGTSAPPIPVWICRKTMQEWYALFEARTRRRFNVSIKDRWAILGGKMIFDAGKDKPPFWLFDAGLNQLYMSIYHLKPENCEYYLNALERYGISHIIGYPSSLFNLADAAKTLALKAPKLKVAISNAESLQPSWKNTISEVFSCSVQRTYGMVELSFFATDCRYGSMHVCPEVGILEIFDENEGTFVNDSREGKILITGLFNEDMPFIRYDVGDIGRAVLYKKCGCGREMPVLEDILGRDNCVVTTPDGRRIYWVDNTFFDLHVKEVQLIQESIDRLHFLVVPYEGYSEVDEKAIKERTLRKIGPVDIKIDLVERIPRLNNGKFRGVVPLAARQS